MHYVVFPKFLGARQFFASLVYNLYTLGLGPVLLIYLLLTYQKKNEMNFPSLFGSVTMLKWGFGVLFLQCGIAVYMRCTCFYLLLFGASLQPQPPSPTKIEIIIIIM